jgi:CRISPR-associated endonuclease/helicase Cas3
MGNLEAADFAEFYRAVHGHGTFPWQEQVVAKVLADGTWPDLVDVPTGLGKTSMLDVAVFVAAATVNTPGSERVGRRRTFFVVDRRLVVDEAHQHAARIAKKLAEAETGVVGAVSSALRRFAPSWTGEVLPVTKMRGGATWDAAWLERPDLPGVVLGTVDQVGSRLFFRGYGVSERRRPLDAALVGTDAVLFVDEAHLSSALLTTITAAHARDHLGLPVPGLSVVQLSATARQDAAEPGRPFPFNVAAHLAHPVAARRLNASKTLRAVSSTPRDVVKALATAATRAVDQLSHVEGATHPPVVLVVCNTVDRARAVHDRLAKELTPKDGSPSVDCELLIGRSRPADRPQLHEWLTATMGVGREPGARPAVLVATQTVEVGINLDADALITESASWDALVQRLGRLNRLGDFADRFPGVGEAAAVIIHDGQANGPVYGTARDAVWGTLTGLVRDRPDGLSVTPLRCRTYSAEHFAGPEHIRTDAYVPVLQVPTLDAWTQTAPTPLNDPPVAPFLHGVDGGVPGVLVAWRAGLRLDDPLDVFSDDGAELPHNDAEQLLAAVPVRGGEQVEVPFMAVRQWMSGYPAVPVSDLEGVADEETQPKGDPRPFQVLVRRVERSGADMETGASARWRWIGPLQLRPGDAIVVPAEQGGLDRYGWNPTSTATVPDVSEAATFAPRRSSQAIGMLRLDVDLPGRLGVDTNTGHLAEVIVAAREEPEDSSSALADLIQALAQSVPQTPPDQLGWSPDGWDRLKRWLQRGRHKRVVVRSAPRAVLEGAWPDTLTVLVTGVIPVDGQSNALIDRDDDEVASSSVGVRRDDDTGGSVTLDQHHGNVRERAGEIARSLLLPDDVRQILEDAAGWHDLGKLEDRFQAMLHDGDAAAALVAPQPLAKSGMDPADRLSWRRARIRSLLPAGARHEAWSAALVRAYLREREQAGTPYEHDADLLIHLVASHHGHARPLLPLVIDSDPRPVDAVIGDTKVTTPSDDVVDIDHPARFAALNARYGRWGLALLESVVRCADMTVSAEGS